VTSLAAADSEDRVGGLKGVWDAIDISPDLGGQNLLKTFKMAIRHNTWLTGRELERVFCCWIYFALRSEIFFGPLTGVIAPSPAC